MGIIIWILLLLGFVAAVSLISAPLLVWTAVVAGMLIVAGLLGALPTAFGVVAWLVFAAVAVVLNVPSIRQRVISGPLLSRVRKVLPPISDTEREAIELRIGQSSRRSRRRRSPKKSRRIWTDRSRRFAKCWTTGRSRMN